ncbi:MAG TPA: cbb3-type cytochrome c oxidase subunit I [Candidatus Azoamicus sp. OHIO2]
MKFKSQQIAYYFFAASMLLLSLQLVYGLIMAFAHLGYDVLHNIIPFNVARATHNNLLLVWLLSGFMGATYYIIPEEVDRELVSLPLAVVQYIALVIVGITAIIGFHFNWWEGRKFLEIPRALDYLVVVDVLLFLGIVGLTILKAQRRTTTSLILYGALFAIALLYLPGMIDTTNQTVDSFWRWWVVHLWVEGVWELVLGSLLAFLLIKLTGVDRELVEKWLYIIIGLTFLSGVLGTGHHYYWIGTPQYWLFVGGFFSALEPLAFLGITIYSFYIFNKRVIDHPNKIALTWTLGCSVMSFVGAGFLGFVHTLPSINIYTHGTLITAMHGHLAFWGAYAMIVISMISYTLPIITDNKAIYTYKISKYAFWASNIGMIGMVMSFALAGIVQVYLERMLDLDFFVVREELKFFFGCLIALACLFISGIVSFIYTFIRSGLPKVSKFNKNY